MHDKKNYKFKRSIVNRKKCNVIRYNSCNDLPRCLKQIYKKMLYINETEKRTFSHSDFPLIKRGYFRQIIHRLGKRIQVVVKGKPSFYKISGIKLPTDSHAVTFEPTEGAKMIEDILKTLAEQPPTIHDIKLKFESNIHFKLEKIGHTKHPKNRGIKISYPHMDNNRKIHIMAYPQTTLIDIECTYKPIVYDDSGVFSLLCLLADIRAYLNGLTNFTATIPEAHQWICTHYHFGKDSSAIFDGQAFHCTFQALASGFVRYYSKLMPDGSTIERLETIKTPNKPIIKILMDIIHKSKS